MQKIKDFTVGADPELFIYDTSRQKIISSDGIIPGEKGDPYRSDDMPEGFGLEVDNILGEFNIPPCTTKEEWLHNINYIIGCDYASEYISGFQFHDIMLFDLDKFKHLRRGKIFRYFYTTVIIK